MRIAIFVTLGVVLALALVLLARQRRRAGELRIYAVGLFAAALIYVGFVTLRAGSGRGPALELAGVAVFGLLAWRGVRTGSGTLLAVGWAAHVLWDVLLHLSDAPGSAYTPDWYPWLCVGFDLVIAGALVRRPRRPTRAAPVGGSRAE
ncbi:MAG TPA: DUF6010 family protein [Longimicrobium sp.]|nr:DUF6010 family protein [Longimicrobium sp.]